MYIKVEKARPYKIHFLRKKIYCNLRVPFYIKTLSN